MRLKIFLQFMAVSACASLVSFSLLAATLMESVRMMALGAVLSMGIAAAYPELRGVRKGDPVTVVPDAAVPGLMGKPGRAASDGRKNARIRVALPNGTEALGVVESNAGLLSPPKVRMIYEERPVY